MSFFTYVIAFFCPPLALIILKQYRGLIINILVYGVACVCVITIVFIPVGVIAWACAMIQAMWYVRKRLQVEQADLLATKMAEKMRQDKP